MSQRIRLMTHNVWNCDGNHKAWEEKGEDCSAKKRVGALVRIYRETLPDIIGGQEVSVLMADLLKENLLDCGMDYTFIWGRFTPIMYRADKFELLDSHFESYPEKIEGFEGSFNDVRSKSMNIAVFREKQSSFTFVFATTHLWWKKTDEKFIGTSSYQAHSDEARTYQMGLLIKKINEFKAKYNCPAIVVGDLNTGYNSEAVQLLLKNGYKHAHDVATEYAEESVGLHYCYPAGYETYYYDRPFETAIDHIIVSDDAKDYVRRFERYSPDYYFPISDHSPSFIDVEI